MNIIDMQAPERAAQAPIDSIPFFLSALEGAIDRAAREIPHAGRGVIALQAAEYFRIETHNQARLAVVILQSELGANGKIYSAVILAALARFLDQEGAQ